MKNPSYNQTQDIVDYIHDIYERNNPELADDTERSNTLYSDIGICVDEFFGNMRTQIESHK